MIPIEDWKRLRLVAAERNMSITEFIMKWIEPELRKLNVKESSRD